MRGKKQKSGCAVDWEREEGRERVDERIIVHGGDTGAKNKYQKRVMIHHKGPNGMASRRLATSSSAHHHPFGMTVQLTWGPSWGLETQKPQ